MHAAIFQVDVKQDWAGDAEAELDFVVELSKQAPGFASGLWLMGSDGLDAISVQLFETEAAAREAVAGAFVPPDASVTLRSASVYELQRQC